MTFHELLKAGCEWPSCTPLALFAGDDKRCERKFGPMNGAIYNRKNEPRRFSAILFALKLVILPDILTEKGEVPGNR